MDVYITEKMSGYSIALSMLPEKIKVRSSANFQSYEIMDIGEVKFTSGEELQEVSWEGMFPKREVLSLPFVKRWHWISPEQMIAVIEDWRKDGTILTLMVTGTPINIDVLVKDFKVTHEKKNFVDYDIEFIQYKELKVYTVSELNAIRKANKKYSRAISNVAYSREKTIQYAVRKGDNLWVIAQRFLNNGNRYMEIFDMNRDVIGPDPHLIKTGMVLKIPK